PRVAASERHCGPLVAARADVGRRARIPERARILSVAEHCARLRPDLEKLERLALDDDRGEAGVAHGLVKLARIPERALAVRDRDRLVFATPHAALPLDDQEELRAGGLVHSDETARLELQERDLHVPRAARDAGNRRAA